MKKTLLALLLCAALLCGIASAEGLPGATPEEMPVDLDLSTLSGTVVYSQVYDMIMEPELYLGQIVRMRGNFSYFQNPETLQELRRHHRRRHGLLRPGHRIHMGRRAQLPQRLSSPRHRDHRDRHLWNLRRIRHHLPAPGGRGADLGGPGLLKSRIFPHTGLAQRQITVYNECIL